MLEVTYLFLAAGTFLGDLVRLQIRWTDQLAMPRI